MTEDDDRDSCESCGETFYPTDNSSQEVVDARLSIVETLAGLSSNFEVPENSFLTGFFAIAEYQRPDGYYELCIVTGDPSGKPLAPWRTNGMLSVLE